MKVIVSISNQQLDLIDDNGITLRRYPVSTALKGGGELAGSFCTPRGMHLIRAKIGSGLPENSVFVRRRPTGEVYTAELAVHFPGRDWILTRILWLSGCEVGRNRLGIVDTMRRFIYIHGTPDIEPMGIARSHGCIRMRSADLLDLYQIVSVGTLVEII